jgi:hypothetical protein
MSETVEKTVELGVYVLPGHEGVIRMPIGTLFVNFTIDKERLAVSYLRPNTTRMVNFEFKIMSQYSIAPDPRARGMRILGVRGFKNTLMVCFIGEGKLDPNDEPIGAF